MAGRSTEEVKRDLDSELEHLDSAVKTLRSQAERVRRRLPFLAIAAAGAGLIVRTAARRFARRRGASTSARRG
jgi:hypothetical protein